MACAQCLTEVVITTVTSPVRTLFTAFGVPEEAGLVWKPQTTIEVNETQASTLIKLLDVLDDNDDVQAIASNFDIPEDVMAKLA